LFSQNPPVRELLDVEPDELWVIQINPTRADREPRTVVEIADRRNELAGNLSLYQELRVIEEIDQLLEQGRLTPNGTHRPIVVRVLELPRERLSRMSEALGAASKLNRDPTFLRNLIEHGEDRAEEFLTALAFEVAWRRRDTDAVLGFLDVDVDVSCAAPFPVQGPYRGAEQVRAFIREHLEGDARMDPTRKHIARDRVTWAVRTPPDFPGPRISGIVEARFRSGRITDLRLGPAG
jgi:NTE family protein